MLKLKRTLFLFVILSMVAVPVMAQDDGPFRVAVVMPSTADDLAWSQALIDSLTAVQEELGGEEAMEIAVSENLWQVADATEALRDYASQGYDLVFAHGTQYGGPLFDLAPDFPDVSFAWGTAADTGEDEGLTNIFAYEARAEQGGYINGIIAATLTETGVVGIVGPVAAGDALLYIDGFRVGVMAANEDISEDEQVEILLSYTGDFGDTALAAEAARTHIAAGADILTGSAQQVPGVIEAIGEEDGLYLATQVDQSEGWPEVVIAAQVFDWTDVIMDMIELRKEGVMGGVAYELSLENGGMTMVLNEDLAEELFGEDGVEMLNSLISDLTDLIVDGDIDVMELVEELQAAEAEESDG
jgi:basic membrane protein A